MLIRMTPAADVVAGAFARGLEPDPNMPLDEWADEYMVIPKSAGASEYGKYRTSRTPHAREVMRALSANHPCKRVVVKGASQMLKTQVGLNWLACTIHQSPTNFLWIAPTGKLQKRASTRISKTLEAVNVVKERVAAPRSRDSVNTLDTKEYDGGALTIVTAGAAANLSELSVRFVLYDEIDRTPRNVDGEGASWKLGEARQTSFERNRKSYYPSSPTIEDESEIDDLYKMGTQREALADCVHCGVEQPLVFERLKPTDDAQGVYYPCFDCGGVMHETDKNRMFARGAWSAGVPGDGETESFTINAMFLPYGWASWLVLHKEYQAAKAKLAQGDDTLMITFYNTRLARCWARVKEQTKASELEDRAEGYRLGTVPRGGMILTAAVDTQPDRLEFKVVAWGAFMQCWIIDYQILIGAPAELDVWKRLDVLLKSRYRHAGGQMLPISATLVDSGGHNTQDVYNYTSTRQLNHVFAIKGESKPSKPVLPVKPVLVDIDWQGRKQEKGAKLWFIGTDTAKDYLTNCFKLQGGPGAVHFSKDLPKEYYEQLTAEYRVSTFKRGRKVSVWDKPNGARNEALDLMVYNLAAAHYLGLHRKTEAQWDYIRDVVDPTTGDLFLQPDPAPEPVAEADEQPTGDVSSEPPPPPVPQESSPPQAKQSEPVSIERAKPWTPEQTEKISTRPTKRATGRAW